MNSKRVFITGAGGFLGFHLVDVLQKEKVEVSAGMRPEFNLLENESIKKELAKTKPEVVIHAAAYGVNLDEEKNWETAVRTNVEGSLRLLSAAADAGVKRFIHIGSCFEYGDKDHPVREDELLAPTSLYAATKAAASLLVREQSRALKIPAVVVRPFGMWGPREKKHRLVPQVLEACRARKPLALTSCEVWRDMTYVGDMAEAIVKVALCRDFPSGEILNLGSGHPVLLKDFVLGIARHFGAEKWMEFGKRPQRPREMRCVIPDLGAWKKLGLGPIAKTPLTRGLEIMEQM